ncbi:hypothetical protein [Butyrivibrio proteoclasticus]|uniref:hypothetical protein n=1 Tax=Butyrivibrio proteoclasticus TaxID=43305 RepID=UPI0002F12BAD|nr:hypothetical protein [Butyrivibrio proteoclasticus]
MKILVDSLPYYGDWCPFMDNCPQFESDCPRDWDKYKVCDDEENPRECCYLKEIGTYMKENGR